jgi:hypothetical protein
LLKNRFFEVVQPSSDHPKIASAIFSIYFLKEVAGSSFSLNAFSDFELTAVRKEIKLSSTHSFLR